jgi:hypothetical protein
MGFESKSLERLEEMIEVGFKEGFSMISAVVGVFSTNNSCDSNVPNNKTSKTR